MLRHHKGEKASLVTMHKYGYVFIFFDTFSIQKANSNYKLYICKYHCHVVLNASEVCYGMDADDANAVCL